ncbi:MAG: phosphate ABC transporter permease subunit PstC [Atopococcus tabaci]|uniref:Phosphate transport system permease protein n=1 Tax=Atopococcus tabaci TaxID=269774 RepID=A0AA43UCF8_9LACT|nr:phosphate ABC transporter permease subunit PstC [Atopococcus tabaci]
MDQKASESIWRGIFLMSALVSVVSLVLIITFIFANGLPFMIDYGIGDFLFGQQWAPSPDWTAQDPKGAFGVLPMILGSFYTTIGAVIIGAPIGILTAIYLAYFCPEWLYKVLRPAVNLMAGIPSVVFGFFGLQVIVPWIRNSLPSNGLSMLAAMIVLAIMILPTVISISETSLRAVPSVFYNGGIALGATHERSVFTVVFPAARSGVISSVVLGMGRAIGETMAVQLVIGNQARISFNILDGIRTLTTNIILEMGYASGTHRTALISTAVVLFFFIILINAVFLILKNRGESY